MKLYILRRLLLLVPLVFGITLVTFALMKALPGDPALGMVGERASPEVIESIRKELGAEGNFFDQYVGYVRLLLKGELGRSYYTNREVSVELMKKLPNTMKLALAAMLIAAPLGVLLGLLAALKRGSFFDRAITTISVAGISMPVFWAGLLIMFFFSFKLRLLPPSGTGDLRFLVLPALTLSLPAVATLSRISRSSVIEILDMPFLQAVRAKGLGNARIISVHILRNALIPIVTVIGLDFGSYLNGAVLTETIFGWDGLGRFAMDGIIRRDYPVVLGAILLGTMVFATVNLFVDLAYSYLDPRVRLHGKK